MRLIEELKSQTLLSSERFLELLVDKIGYSSYLKTQIRSELQIAGDPMTQITVLQGAIRELYRASRVPSHPPPIRESHGGPSVKVSRRRSGNPHRLKQPDLPITSIE